MMKARIHHDENDGPAANVRLAHHHGFMLAGLFLLRLDPLAVWHAVLETQRIGGDQILEELLE